MKNLRVSPSTALTSLRGLLPTITSSVFSDVVIVLQEATGYDMCSIEDILAYVVRHAYRVKPFRLVFRLEVWEGNRNYVSGELRRYIDEETTKGRLDFLHCPPVIVYATWVRCPTWELDRV